MGTSEAPPFWWQKADWRAALLWPVSLAWGPIAARRARATRKVDFELPVISVSTLAIGATGRTIVAIEMARAALAAGRRPGLLTAGPPGTPAAPHRVDAHHDLVRHVGGEALELARVAPAVICADMPAGARALAADGCDLIIIADGRMSDRLAPDRLVVVADARRGLGNGHVVPAGPVRAPLVTLLRQAHAVVRLGEGDAADGVVRLAARAARPVIEARIDLAGDGTGDMAGDGRAALALAAIGDNEAFFETLRRAGVTIAMKRGFADGHLYAADELADLEAVAAAQDLRVVTTVRDLDRLRQAGDAAAPLLRRTVAARPTVTFDPVGALEALVRDAVLDWRSRRSV
jgi:tetraacyldisaccharide 4'-kinase